MSALGALVRSLEDPRVPFTDPALSDWLNGGPSPAGVPVNERSAMGLSAYYRALSLMSSTVAGLPFKIYRNNTRERITQRTVLSSPNPRQTPFEFWQTIVVNALSWGNAYGRKVRDGSGTVRQVWPIHPSRVNVEEVDPTDANPAGKLFDVATKSGQKKLTSFDLMHIPFLAVDGVQGVRPLQLFRTELGIAIAADQSAATFYANGSQVSGVLQTKEELAPGEPERLQNRWDEKHAGVSAAHKIAVLDNGLEFKAISLPPGDAQLLESRKFSVIEIARMFGIPPHMLMDVEKSTSWGTGIEQQTLTFVVFAVKHWLDLIEQRVTRELLPGGWDSGSWYAEFSLEGLLRADSASRATFYHQGIVDGWLNRNEARVMENREPSEGLDEFLVPSNLTLISVDGKLVPLSAQGTQDEPVDTGGDV